LKIMRTTSNVEHDDERARGAEHPDLVISGEEEHPLWLPILELYDEDDPLRPPIT
jgi:hypothetical protein